MTVTLRTLCQRLWRPFCLLIGHAGHWQYTTPDHGICGGTYCRRCGLTSPLLPLPPVPADVLARIRGGLAPDAWIATNTQTDGETR